MFGDERLNTSFRRTIEKNKDKDLIFISPISIWEVGMLVQKKRIELEIDCLDWVEEALSRVSLLTFTPRIAIQSTRLPENPHGDPADRILIATAYEHNAILVTHDQKIIDYGKSQFIGVFDPCS